MTNAPLNDWLLSIDQWEDSARGRKNEKREKREKREKKGKKEKSTSISRRRKR